ncbi:hypothetical protein KXD93_11210 [Mucilaginibacter sp. BJC16-A38]|uniref:hypothetical protein n=1 Tax=Mucilaginibacter phenanthrenivorans TaxID=1234842 RepID=UPI0021580EFF|nr:hypothetical protein [Mucilaginibacter phenanthrenivorans]MCR8558217.1 hypothetical protein [Mucilaginibacter phenanthrenivorans]
MMGKLYAFIVFLVLSVGALAQSRDTVYKDTAKRIGGPGDHPLIDNNPLILIDGTVYKGNLNKLDPNSISEINVVKDVAAIKMYGKRGENGVIFVTTKGHQNIYNQKASGAYHPELPDSAMYVIDGEISDKKLDGIDPKGILSIDILKKNKGTESMESDVSHDMVIVVTRAGAVRSYQTKLSSLSAPYKKYLDNHNNDDSGLNYVVDGDIYNKGDASLEKLYKLPKENIAKITLSTRDKITNLNITTRK